MKERSIFWPLVMIAAGVLWLMVGMEIIPRANLWALIHILPFFLIALGVGLILRAYWRFAGIFVSLLVVAGAVMAVFYAPQFGWDAVPSWSWVVWDVDPNLGGAVAGSGDVKTEERQVSGFDTLEIDYPAEITVRQGTSESVVIEADDNLLPQLSTEVRNGTLEFKNSERRWSERVNPSATVQVTITVLDLNRISFPGAGKMHIESLETDSLEFSVSGAGDIELIDLNAETLEVSLSGAGNFYADGTADNLQLRISGLGNFKGNELESQSAEIRISGAGSATVWVQSQLDASISGAGSVNYYGNPDVSKNISGVGSVTKVGK
jgi:hypothetical protein